MVSERRETAALLVFGVNEIAEERHSSCAVDESADDEETWLARNPKLRRMKTEHGETGLFLQPNNMGVPLVFSPDYGYTFNAVNHVLVIAGGVTRAHTRRFAYLDLRDGCGWRRDELRFSHPRGNPLTVAVGGKLYFFGRSEGGLGFTDGLLPWQHPEVFDTDSKTLMPLPGDLSFLTSDYAFRQAFSFCPKQVVALDDHTILVFAVSAIPQTSLVLVYDIPSGKWSSSTTGPCFPPEFIAIINFTKLVAFGGSIYWFSPLTSRLHAYEVTLKGTDPFPHSCSDPIKLGHRRTANYASLHAVSPGHLCVVWHDGFHYKSSSGYDSPQREARRLCVAKLHVSTPTPGINASPHTHGSVATLHVSVNAVHNYYLPLSMSYIKDCLMGSFTSDAQEKLKRCKDTDPEDAGSSKLKKSRPW